MPFCELDLRLSYDTGLSDPVDEFYIPVLIKSVSYDRIAGYFSSSSLAVAARGIAGLLGNKGKMRLIASHHLTEEDYLTIQKAMTSPWDYVQEQFIQSVDNIEDEFVRDHLRALGWMLSNGYLQIKLAFVRNSIGQISDALFHQKIGVFTDIDGNQISFSGSINETAAGWKQNVEEFKVFRSWIDGQDQYIEEDKWKFQSLWDGLREDVSVVSISEAVKNKLIEIGNSFDTNAKTYQRGNLLRAMLPDKPDIELFSYQKEALDTWIKSNCRLLFEMATGTGKTRTAIACVNEILKMQDRLVVIISCPQNTLSRQWENEIMKLGLVFDYRVIADGTNHSWRDDLLNAFVKVSIGYYKHVVVYTTHETCSVQSFTDAVYRASSTISFCFIGDEVHGLGAENAQKGLLERYNFRIGLSATPSRWFDDIGTSLIVDYFGNKSFVFTIKDALMTINPKTNKFFLVDFEYIPVFVELTDEELVAYSELSSKVSKYASYAKSSEEYKRAFENLIFMRANVCKSASNKLSSLERILSRINDLQDVIIFVAPEQIDEVMKLLQRLGITAHRVTQSQGTISEQKYNGLSERQYLIKKFIERQYQVLVAIKCLDEGIDIPSATTAIIMSSSTNPREYVQRIGRVIRQAPNKSKAIIYDFVIVPSLQRNCTRDVAEMEKKIFEKELVRVKDMSSYSINNADVYEQLNTIMERLIHGNQNHLY